MRHESFIVARVDKRYRTLAVIQNEWLHPILVVRQCLLIMKMLSADGNIPGIRRELALAASKPAEFWCSKDKKREQNRQAVDFPFLTTCLLLGTGLRVKGGVYPSRHLPFEVQYGGTGGTSIFDITQLGQPRYALFSFRNAAPATNMPELEELYKNTALNASGYMQLRRYRHQKSDSDPEDHLHVLELDSLPLLHIESLEIVWPQENFQGRAGTLFSRGLWTAGVLADAHTIRNPIKSPRVSNARDGTSDNAAAERPIASLRKSALDAVVQEAVDCDDTSWMDEAEQLQGFIEHLRAYLYAHTDSVHPGTPCSLLILALKECFKVDLSPFSGLVFSQVLEIVASMSTRKISLVLPDLDDFSTKNLRHLLSTGNVIELRIGKHQMGSLGNIIKDIGGTSVARLITPEMYSRRIKDIANIRKPHQSQSSTRGRRLPRPPLAAGIRCESFSYSLGSLPRPKQFPIVQLLHAMSPGVLSTASVVSLLSLPMGEWFLSATEGVRVLSEFLNTFTTTSCSLSFDVGREVIGALERLSLKTKDDLTVDPLPGDLTVLVKQMCSTIPAPSAPSRPLAFGEWTIVTCYLPELRDLTLSPRLRYGFATLNAKGETIVANTTEFLHAHNSGGETADIEAHVLRWEQDITALSQRVNHKRAAFERSRGQSTSSAPGGVPELEMALFAADEVNEIFKALGNVGRLVPPP
ncbi:hypothetical protein Q7P37_008949 [Cladosporium fusiforme]